MLCGDVRDLTLQDDGTLETRVAQSASCLPALSVSSLEHDLCCVAFCFVQLLYRVHSVCVCECSLRSSAAVTPGVLMSSDVPVSRYVIAVRPKDAVGNSQASHNKQINVSEMYVYFVFYIFFFNV